jgi:hypothetical protein
MTTKNGIAILRMTGRCANGAEREGGTRYHAVFNWRALSGAKPGRLSDWSGYPGEAVTCPRCLNRLKKYWD